MRVLILEDDPLIGLDLESLVESLGHEVVSVSGSLAAAERHVERGLDFALLDIDLPDGKSFGLAARLDCRGIPFVFVSASSASELPDHLRHAAFIAKPYQPAAIVKAIRGGPRPKTEPLKRFA